MPQFDMQLVQWIAEHLQYKTLPRLIGTVYQIESLRSLEADLREFLSPVIPGLRKLVDPDFILIKQILAKHKILDLTFAIMASPQILPASGGLELLSELGFLMDDNEAEQFDYVASLIGDNFDDPTLLGELEADLLESQTVLRILLEDIDGAQKTFSVVDACITNAPSVWLHKYPYY